jgi:putative DNA primase/helicase
VVASPLRFIGRSRIGGQLGEIGKKARAGQEVRLVDVPADAGRGLGLFEELHGSEGAKAFAGRLTDAALRCHGSAAVAYLEELAAKLATDAGGLRARTAP